MNDLISRKWLMECVDEGWIKFDTEKDKNTYVHLVRDIAPSEQPELPKQFMSDDCISRSELYKKVHEAEEYLGQIKYLEAKIERLNGVIEGLKFAVRCNGVSGGEVL